MSVKAVSAGGYRVKLTADNHELMADEPVGIGTGQGPTPYDLLLSALGACTAMTVRMYANRKGWALEDVEVKLDTYKVHARDCEDCESEPHSRVDIIEMEVTFEGGLSPEEIERLTEIARRCPVHRTLTTETKIRVAARGEG